MTFTRPRPCVNGSNHTSQIDQMMHGPDSIGVPAFSADGVQMTIEYFSAFEAFNTRPYHNYETWGAGWRITLHASDARHFGKDIKVENECLVCGMRGALAKLKEARQQWLEQQLSSPPKDMVLPLGDGASDALDDHDAWEVFG